MSAPDAGDSRIRLPTEIGDEKARSLPPTAVASTL
jgi:hypothetical protein